MLHSQTMNSSSIIELYKEAFVDKHDHLFAYIRYLALLCKKSTNLTAEKRFGTSI